MSNLAGFWQLCRDRGIPLENVSWSGQSPVLLFSSSATESQILEAHALAATSPFAGHGLDHTRLREELVNDPLQRGYAMLTDAECAADLNEMRYTALQPGRFLTARGVVNLLGVADAAIVLATFKAAAAGNVALEIMYDYLRGEIGIDFGVEATHQNIDMLSAAFPPGAAQKLKDYGTRQFSRATQISLGGTPTERDVAFARTLEG